jgi:repressor of nif and glnA expression
VKLSLATQILGLIESSYVPVPTTVLVGLAEELGYKNARAQVWYNLKMLKLHGFIKAERVGRPAKGVAGGLPSRWVPTIGNKVAAVRPAE